MEREGKVEPHNDESSFLLRDKKRAHGLAGVGGAITSSLVLETRPM